MAMRPEIRPYSAITNGSMVNTLTGLSTIVQKISILSYQFVWTAGSSPIGTVGVQVSNDFSIDPTGTISNAGTWSTYYFLIGAGTYATSIAVSGSTGNAIIELPTLSFYAIRPIYTRSSGTGTLNVILNGKVAKDEKTTLLFIPPTINRKPSRYSESH